MRTSRGFTLIELLVVIGIITLLIALLIPSLGLARRVMREVTCQTHQKGIAMAFFSYAGENRDVMPLNSNGVHADDWLTRGKDKAERVKNAPFKGLLYREEFITTIEVFRCPSLPEGVLFSGEGSNGKFDYGAFGSFNAAKWGNLENRARVKLQGLGDYEYLPVTPLITEETPTQINGKNCEGHHANVDEMGYWHPSGGAYGGMDGSSHKLRDPDDKTIYAKNWESIGPKTGKWKTIGKSDAYKHPGWWNDQ